LPYDVRHSILSEFVNIVLDEYNRRRDWLKRCGTRLDKDIEDWEDDDSEVDDSEEEYWSDEDSDEDWEDDDDWEEEEDDEDDEDDWDLPRHLRSRKPLPLAWFASAVRVNHDFYETLNRIKLGGYPAPEKVKRAQCELLELTVKAHERMYMNFDGQFYTYLDQITEVVGNFWKNYDCFLHGVNILARIHNLLHRSGDELVPFLFPFLQHLSETAVSSNELPITIKPTIHDPDSGPPPPFIVQPLYSETCTCYIPVSGGDTRDAEVKIFRVIGISSDFAKVLADLRRYEVAKDIDASPSGEWLAVSFGESFLDLDYFVNIQKKRVYKCKGEDSEYDKEGNYIQFPDDWEDVSADFFDYFGHV
jgi:hypothetical protein